MSKTRAFQRALAFLIIGLACATAARAQATRTWVSGVGDDANPCSRTAPCKTFVGAISKTAVNGEIDVLDPGGYGPVTITKSITIDGSGTSASILAGTTSGITVNLTNTSGGDPLHTVRIRGLSISGAGQSGGAGTRTGINGINVLPGAGTPPTVNIEDVVIDGFTNNGINVTMGGSGTVSIRNTVVRNCAGDGASFTTTAGTLSGVIQHSFFVNNGNGLHAKSGSKIEVHDSTFSLNTSNGVLADGQTLFAGVSLFTSIISSNGANGVQAGNSGNTAFSVIAISQNQIDSNAARGVNIVAPAAVYTFANNSILGNGTDGCVGCTNAAPGS